MNLHLKLPEPAASWFQVRTPRPLKWIGITKNPCRWMCQQQGLFQVSVIHLFPDSVSPGFDHLVFILASPDMVVIDQFDLIQGD
jgi:hypothetical protein